MNNATKPVGTAAFQIAVAPGETALQDAVAKARMFATRERVMLAGKRKPPVKPASK